MGWLERSTPLFSGIIYTGQKFNGKTAVSEAVTSGFDSRMARHGRLSESGLRSSVANRKSLKGDHRFKSCTFRQGLKRRREVIAILFVFVVGAVMGWLCASLQGTIAMDDQKREYCKMMNDQAKTYHAMGEKHGRRLAANDALIASVLSEKTK